MASSKIKGIVIEIGGNTTKLQDALKQTDKQVYALNSDLKALNQALKLDPKNTDLLAQKYDVLKKNIFETSYRLDKLKEAQRQMGDYSKLTDQQKESYNQLSLEIAKSENALKSMNEELKNANKADLTKLKDGLKKVGDVALEVSKKMLQVTSAVAGALTAVVGAGVKSYAELEKAHKGSERLFGTAFSTVKKNATDAYKTMGISAKDYYDQVNTYAVGLKDSLGGDAEKSAKLANDILVAQADIVASTGASQEAVQNAFAAVMRGNFTLIDNLRLGIKGSKQGMQEVINKVNEWNKAQGNATNYQMGNYADMQQALVDYVKMQKIAGTASQQLSSTISGSVSQMKAAWDNFINGTGNAKQLASTITTVVKNVSVVLKQLAPEILKGIADLTGELLPQISTMLLDLVPQLLDSITMMIDNILDLVSQDTTELQKTIDKLIESIILFITNNLPKLVKIALQIVVALAKGIINNIDVLIPAVLECILEIINTIITSLPKILKLGMDLVVELGKGILKAAPEAVIGAGKVTVNILKEFAKGISGIFEIGKNLVAGLWEGIKSVSSWLWEKITGFGKAVLNGLKSIFGIASPSKATRWQGQMLGEGYVEGIEDTIPQVENAMRELATGVDASVNPTINPTANSNPLFLTIDKFYNNRETDIQQLAEELEFYRKNSALAKGGV
ncbi:MAG: hypothetical protein II625_00275 [Bacilli bacterium]|nr:hypothetical protein [Bacilli bacterium]